MSCHRLVLQTRLFWPLVGHSATTTRLLAQGLRAAGESVTVVAARYERTWPQFFLFGDIPVVGLAHYGSARWAGLRYLLAWGKWLRKHREQLDVVHLIGVRHEAYMTLNTVQPRTLVVARGDGVGPNGDCQWWQRYPFGRRLRRRCLVAAQAGPETKEPLPAHRTPRLVVVAESKEQRQEFLAAGFPSQSVPLIPPGIPLPEERTLGRVRMARQVVAQANHEMSIPSGGILGLSVGPLVEHRQLDVVIRCWRKVVQRYPQARLWIVGDGPERHKLWRLVRQSDLETHVFLPGTFDDMSEVYFAADFCIVPASEGSVSWAVLEAMAFGLPIVAVDSPVHRTVLPSELHDFLASKATPDLLAQSVLRFLGQPEQWSALGALGRAKVGTDFTFEKMIHRYRSLWSQADRCSGDVPGDGDISQVPDAANHVPRRSQ